jgi:hypothetical protein
MLSTTGATPHDLGLHRIQLKAVAAHAAGDVTDVGRQMELQQINR